jgi:allantoinase
MNKNGGTSFACVTCVSFDPQPTRFAWPGNKQLAVYVALCVEHFSYGSGLGLPYSPGLNQPNSYNWGWREYGNRVGGWRLLELFEEFGLPLSVLLNTACYDHCPRQCHQPLAR